MKIAWLPLTLCLCLGVPGAARAADRTVVGVGTGAVAGAVVAGPVGAVIGAVAGGFIGASSGARPRSRRSGRRRHAGTVTSQPVRYVRRSDAVDAQPPRARSEVSTAEIVPAATGGWRDPR